MSHTVKLLVLAAHKHHFLTFLLRIPLGISNRCPISLTSKVRSRLNVQEAGQMRNANMIRRTGYPGIIGSPYRKPPAVQGVRDIRLAIF